MTLSTIYLVYLVICLAWVSGLAGFALGSRHVLKAWERSNRATMDYIEATLADLEIDP